MILEIDIILQTLKDSLHLRSQKSLDKFNHILRDYVTSGGDDFSITNLARVSLENGGPSYAVIRATKNTCYRTLIDAYIAKYVSTKKGNFSKSKNRNLNIEHDVLNKLDNPALKTYFGGIIAENKKLQAEINVLKSQKVFSIDRRTNQTKSEQRNGTNQPDDIQVISPLKTILSHHDIDVLRTAILKQRLINKGWKIVADTWAITDSDNFEIMPRGFVKVIDKIISGFDNE